MRIVLLLLALNVLAGCATSQTQQPIPTPEAFFGKWNKYSGEHLYDINIRGDAMIDVIGKKDHKILQSINYRVIKVENPQDIYIALQNFGHEDASTSIASGQGYFYAHLWIDTDEILHGPFLRYELDWLIDQEHWQKTHPGRDWESMSAEEHWKSFQSISNPDVDFLTGTTFTR